MTKYLFIIFLTGCFNSEFSKSRDAGNDSAINNDSSIELINYEDKDSSFKDYDASIRMDGSLLGDSSNIPNGMDASQISENDAAISVDQYGCTSPDQWCYRANKCYTQEEISKNVAYCNCLRVNNMWKCVVQ